MKKIILFILLTFLISWSVALIMFFSGIQYNSIPSYVLIACFYMSAPAIATVITQKLIYKQKLDMYGLTIKNFSLRSITLPILYIWLIIGCSLGFIFIIGNLAGVYEFGKVSFDNESVLGQAKVFILERFPNLQNTPILPLPFPAVILFFVILLQGAVSGALLNFPFILGEELGWRGLLLKETQKMGYIKSSLFIGVVWGLWHAPLIILGHNFPQYPFTGVIMMTLFTTALSFLLSYIRLRTKNLIGPVIFHGVLNAIGPAVFLFVVGANPLFGSVAGLAGILSIVVLTLVLLRLDPQFMKEYKNL